MALFFFWLLRGMRNSFSTSSGVNTSVLVSDTWASRAVCGDRCRAKLFLRSLVLARESRKHSAVHDRNLGLPKTSNMRVIGMIAKYTSPIENAHRIFPETVLLEFVFDDPLQGIGR